MADLWNTLIRSITSGSLKVLIKRKDIGQSTAPSCHHRPKQSPFVHPTGCLARSWQLFGCSIVKWIGYPECEGIIFFCMNIYFSELAQISRGKRFQFLQSKRTATFGHGAVHALTRICCSLFCFIISCGVVSALCISYLYAKEYSLSWKT